MTRSSSPSAGPDAAKPTAPELKRLLGRGYPAYCRLADRGPGVVAEWRRYKADTPWLLRVTEAKRTHFYVQPEAGACTVTVLLGRRATEAALGGEVPRHLHDAIRGARAYAEGRPVRVIVKRLADLADVEALLAAKLKKRG